MNKLIPITLSNPANSRISHFYGQVRHVLYLAIMKKMISGTKSSLVGDIKNPER